MQQLLSFLSLFVARGLVIHCVASRGTLATARTHELSVYLHGSRDGSRDVTQKLALYGNLTLKIQEGIQEIDRSSVKLCSP